MITAEVHLVIMLMILGTMLGTGIVIMSRKAKLLAYRLHHLVTMGAHSTLLCGCMIALLRQILQSRIVYGSHKQAKDLVELIRGSVRIMESYITMMKRDHGSQITLEPDNIAHLEKDIAALKETIRKSLEVEV